MDPFIPIVAVLALLCCLFFSGMEVAWLFANKLQIELQEKQGMMAGKILARFIKRKSYVTLTAIAGKNISLIFFGILMAQFLRVILEPVFPDHGIAMYVAQVIIITLITLFLVELISFSLVTISPNKVLSWLSVPFLISGVFLFPLVAVIMWLGRKSSAAFDLPSTDVHPLPGISAFKNYLKNSSTTQPGNLELDRKIFHKALEFKSVRVRECMIPRTEILAVSINDPLSRLKEVFIESGHSKIIVYRESLDDVIGYCHSSALFRKPKTIEEMLTPIIVVPETTLANELMIRFINEHKSLAIVMDEFGSTSGLVSMEDVIEEIFGNIEDEFDGDDLIEQQLDKQTWLLSARLEVDYVNEKYSWNLPVGDYDTIGGLILNHTAEIPQPGQRISIPPFLFIIQATSENRINLIKLVADFPAKSPENQ